MKGINTESDGEEIDQETAESDKSTNVDSDSSSGSASDDDSSSELDDEDSARRRNVCIEQMAELEKQFLQIREQLYEERFSQVATRLEEVKLETAEEYLQPLEELRQNKENRFEVADILRDLRIVNVKHYKDAELQAAAQDLESQKALAWDAIKCDLEEKIRRLEEDRNNVDITSDLWNEQEQKNKKNKRKADTPTIGGGKRRKPVTVTGPYIVYMLHENDILEDWTTIRKALKASKQSSEYEFNAGGEQRSTARFADGKLLFKGDAYRKGETVLIDEMKDKTWPAHVISVNTSEVLLQRPDRSYTRIGIGDLQSGRYNIRHD